jgi:hypothetical protein
MWGREQDAVNVENSRRKYLGMAGPGSCWLSESQLRRLSLDQTSLRGAQK